jgi:transketolase
MLRAVWSSTVLYPSDANQTAHLMAEMVDRPGIVYMRTTREKTPVIYDSSEKFKIGGSRVVHQSDSDSVAVVAAGITLHETLKAYEQLKKEGIAIRVIDAYSVKPIDSETLHKAARDTGGRLVVVEDHWPEGGLGDAVLSVFASSSEPLPRVVKLAVRNMPGSATPAQLLDAAGINAAHIVEAVRSLAG